MGDLIIDAWQGTAKDALASGVAQMQHVYELGRSSMRGLRINEQEALCAAAHASGTAASYNADFSAKFERVDSVFIYNKNTDTVVADAQTKPRPFPAISRVVRATVAGDIGNGSNIVIGGLVIVPAANNLATGVILTNAAALRALINASLNLIPAMAVVNNLDGTLDITFNPGADANSLLTTSVDLDLTFAQTIAGAHSGSTNESAKSVLTFDATDADVLLITVVGKLRPTI
jgi:hypothetical protein